jgi:hypothetical protein
MSGEIDPLLPQPPDELKVPPHLTGEDRRRWLFEAALDHMNMGAMVWPARDREGDLQPPPDEHVLDHLARCNELVDEVRALSTLSAGTVAVVVDLPSCDERGSGSLGASGDVYLMRLDEVSDWVRDRYDAVARLRGKPPLR